MIPDHFFDYGTLTYEATVDADKAGYFSITPVDDGIMITGLKSTVKTVLRLAIIMKEPVRYRSSYVGESITVSVTATRQRG